jgi:hypothetical protein
MSEAGQSRVAPRSEARERLLRRLAVALALLVVFGLAEVGLRVFARLSSYIPKVDLYDAPHYLLGRALLPGAAYLSRVGSIHVNSLGFRGPEFTAAKPAGTYRIAAVGGSTTFGYYPATSSDQAAYPAVLERLLNTAKPDSRVARYEVINAGVPGYSLRSSLQNFSSRLLFFQPDMLIVYHATNDLARYGNEDGLMRPLLNQFVPQGVMAGLLDQVMGWSYLFQELRFTLGTRLWGGLLGAPQAGGGGEWRYDPRYELVFRRDLRHLVLLAKANGVVPVLATQAIAFTAKTDFANLTEAERRMLFDRPAHFYGTIPGPQRFAVFQRYNQAIRELALEEGAILADVDAVIPKTPDYHYDYCHLTDRGSVLQAEVIHRAILAAAERTGETAKK